MVTNITINKLDKTMFKSLDKLSINWRKIVSQDPELQKEYNDYLKLKSEWIFCSQDYSQLEIYVLASLCGDASLIGAVNAGLDIHSFNTEKVFKLNLKQLEKDRKLAITEDEILSADAALAMFKAKRKTIKALTFSLSYGAGKEKIASDLRVPVEEAQQLINGFYNTYPKIRLWQGNTLLNAINKGYLETKFGRRRGTPKLLGRNDAYSAFIKEDAKIISNLKRNGEYWSLREEFKTVLNTDIQSLSSDMCSLAACKFNAWLNSSDLRGEMYFWIHDSIGYSCHIDDAEQISEQLRIIMENNVKYEGDPVNYRTALEVGYNYEFCSEIKREDWVAPKQNKRTLITSALDKSLDSDLNKKFKLIVKSAALELDDTYLKKIRDAKEEYFDSLVTKLKIAGVYSPKEYVCMMNGCTAEEYDNALELNDEELDA